MKHYNICFTQNRKIIKATATAPESWGSERVQRTLRVDPAINGCVLLEEVETTWETELPTFILTATK